MSTSKKNNQSNPKIPSKIEGIDVFKENPELIKILEELKLEGKNRNLFIAINASLNSYFEKDTIPSVEKLAEYENLLPGSADRIITIHEKEQDSRHNLDDKDLENEKKFIDGSFSVVKRGQILAFSLLIFCVLAGIYTAKEISIPFGSGIIGVSVLSIIISFLKDTFVREKDEEGKSSSVKISKKKK